jgi:hypothetical protein
LWPSRQELGRRPRTASALVVGKTLAEVDRTDAARASADMTSNTVVRSRTSANWQGFIVLLVTLVLLWAIFA